MNRRRKKQLIHLATGLCYAGAVGLIAAPFVLPSPAAERTTLRRRQAAETEIESLPREISSDEFAPLLTKRLQGPPPPPPVETPIPTSVEVDAPPAPPPPPPAPNFRLVNIYTGETTMIASFLSPGGDRQSGTVGETVFDADILKIEPGSRRVQIRYHGHEHWLGIK